MTRKIVNPRLAGKYGKMTAEELDAEVARFDREIHERELKPLTRAMKAALRRARNKGGRPPVGEGAQRVLITVERGLLRKADSYAKSRGMNRSELIAQGLRSILDSAA